MKKALLFVLFLVLVARVQLAQADEGMWLPILLGDYPESEMQRLGMKLTAEDIYSINKPSLKDAVVMFGGVCTAELISAEGLLLTNHHCGFGAIQSHSSIQTDYITNGFWAKNRSEELPNPGLKVVLLVSMEDVTARVLAGVKEDMDETARQELIRENIAKIEAEAAATSKSIAKVKAFFYGNQYILVLTNEFLDVRLVGAPPNRIGDFGGETDNWMWPRHTGDFALFRVYADANNQPAAYSASNVPYQPKKHLTISLKGIKEDEFTMLIGFPGTTQEYLPSAALEILYEAEDPAAIKIREYRIEIMEKYMAMSKLTKIQYSNKRVVIANGWKKMFGEVTGIRRLGAIDKKKALEAKFQHWADESNARKKVYGTLLDRFDEVYQRYRPLRLAYIYYKEAGLGIEAVQFANTFYKFVEYMKSDSATVDGFGKKVEFYKQAAKSFYKNYNVQLDKETFVRLMGIYYKDMDHAYVPDTLLQQGSRFGGDFAKYADYLYGKSELVNEKKTMKMLEELDLKNPSRIEQDPMYMLARSIYGFYTNKLSKQLSDVEAEIFVLQRLYMKGLMEMQSDKKFYPDANGTMRISFGTVKGYELRDGMIYNYFTTLDGVMQKEDTLVADYQVDPRLKELWQNKDYGRYAASDGRMHVCFLATNHTTGGNSGSPVLNAEGQLVGIHFDRVWEGTMSDIYYDNDKCRNIAVDIRYILFLIDKYAGSGQLIKEMTIAN